MKSPENILDDFDQQCAAVVQANGKVLPPIAAFLLPENHERAARHRESLLELLREYQATIDGLNQSNDSHSDTASQSTSAFPSLPGYEFTQILGRGRSVVYEAVQQSTGRLVAIKTLTASAMTPLHSERLKSEAKILAALNHPNIVAVHDFEQHQQSLFLVMQHVSGENLSTRIQREPLPIRLAVEIIQVVAQAIHAAHESGVLHRDLKPSNILVDHKGWVYVTDFDLSRQTDVSASKERLTITGEILGTPGYVSPEQAAGSSRDQSIAADVYGLGATFYHLLTGRPPFVGGTMQVLEQVQNADPVPPQLLRPDVPADVQTICLRCLRKFPSARFSSAAEFSEDLQRYLDGRPIASRPVSVWARGRSWCKRRPAVATLIATTASLLLVSLLLLFDRNRQQTVLLEQTQNSLDHVYDSRIRLALLEFENNNLSEFNRILSELKADERGATPPWEWRWLNSFANAELWKQGLGEFPADWIGAVAFSPDGNSLAVGTSVPLFDDRKRGTKAKLQVLEARTGKLIADLGETMSVTDLRFSPDGHQLYAVEVDIGFDAVKRDFEGPAAVRCWRVSDWQELPRLCKDTEAMHTYISADGRHLLTMDFPSQLPGGENVRNGNLAAFSLVNPSDSSSTSETPPPQMFSNFSVDARATEITATSSDGSSISFLLDDSSLLRNSLRGQIPELMLTQHYQIRLEKQPDSNSMLVRFLRRTDGEIAHVITVDEVECFAVSPDERVAAIASNRGEIRLVNLETWAEFNILRGSSNLIHCMQFSPNSRLLASGDWDGHVRVWDTKRNALYTDSLTSKRGNRLEAFFVKPHNSGTRLAPDSSTNPTDQEDTLAAVVATTDQKHRHTELQLAGPELQTIRIKAKTIAAPGRLAAFSGDSRWLFTTSDESSVIDVRDPLTSEIRGRLPEAVGNIGLVQCSRDYLLTAAWPASTDTLPEHAETQLRVFRGLTAENAHALKPLFSIRLPACRCYRMEISPDRTHLSVARLNFTSSGHGASVVQTWNLASSQLIDEFTLPSWVLALAYHSDGRLFAIDFDEGDLTIRSPTTGRTLQTVQGFSIHQQDLSFSPDGRRLAGTTRGMVTVWNSITLRQVLQLPLRTFASDYVFNPQVRFGPDGRALMAVQPDGTLRTWQY